MTSCEFKVLTEFLSFPLENSDPVFEKFIAMKKGVFHGSEKRRFLYIPGRRKNKVLLVAHADTWWEYYCENDVVFEDGRFFSTGEYGIGADDRAGCAIVWLLKDSGHSILITDGEERGVLGSCYLYSQHREIYDEINREHQFMVEFDRRNGNDFKCYDSGSSDFKKYVALKTGFSEPDKKSTTDIAVLCNKICGVNLSIGFYNEHTENEHLIYEEWLNTLNISRKWLKEKYLPKFKLIR